MLDILKQQYDFIPIHQTKFVCVFGSDPVGSVAQRPSTWDSSEYIPARAGIVTVQTRFRIRMTGLKATAIECAPSVSQRGETLFRMNALGVGEVANHANIVSGTIDKSSQFSVDKSSTTRESHVSVRI